MKTTINLLDPSQKHALEGVLSNKEDVAVIYGPPGTGKSHLILSLLFELAVRGDKVLFISQNTEALNVIVRMYKKLNKELGVSDYSLSFLDFCWCLNDPAQKKVTYIRQQKNRIMEKPINSLPSVTDEGQDDIPYALTYRKLDKNDNLNEQPDKIGFDELLMSSLKNIHRSDLIKDILHSVDDRSYRKALSLLNDYSDKANLFADLNNPKGALRYLNPDRTDYTLHDAKITAEGIYEVISDVISSHEMITGNDMHINDYINYVYQIINYSKVVNLDYFKDSEIRIKDLARIARDRLSIDKQIEETVEIDIDSSISKPLLQEKEDKYILKSSNLVDVRDYGEVLSRIRRNIQQLKATYGVDSGTKLKNVFKCIFNEIKFGVFALNNFEGFNALKYNELHEIIDIVESYMTKNAFSKAVYKIPSDVKILDKKNLNVFVENIDFLKFLALTLRDSGRTVADIENCK